MQLDQGDIDEAWRGFRYRLWRRGFSPTFVDLHAHDLFAQALVEFSGAVAKQIVISNPVGWIIHCSWRRTQGLLDIERRRSHALIDAAASSTVASPAAEDIALEELDGTTATMAISFLPFTQRKLIELIYVEGMSCRAAGRAVGLGKTAADRQHQAALSRLRPFFERSIEESR